MILVFSTLLSVALLGEIFLAYLVKKKVLLSKRDFFPDIPRALIEKFNSFDAELGWVNKPNSIKYDSVVGREIQYTFDNVGSRTALVKSEVIKISSYGDSYCQCREVSDTETWQHYLGFMTDTKVLNFGVGNYGIDQALLRLEREYDLNPTEIVILNFVPEQIKRITSVWKWISELSSVLNFKPRFYANGKYVENINETVYDLCDYQKHKDYLIEHDEHVSYIKKRLLKRPYLISILSKKDVFLYQLVLPIVSRANSLVGGKLEGLHKKLSLNKSLYEVSYMDKCWEKHYKVFQFLMERFVELSRVKNFKPVVLITPQNHERRYMRCKKEKYYQSYLKLIPEECSVFDFGENVFDITDEEQRRLYVHEKGHHSAVANKKIAVILKEGLGL